MPTSPVLTQPKYDATAGVVTLRPLWLSSAFKIAFGPVTDWVFTAKEYTLTITHIDSGTRLQFTESDFTLSDSDTIARLVKDSSWTKTNLQAGWYEGHFAVNGLDDHWATFLFEALEPLGGRIDP